MTLAKHNTWARSLHKTFPKAHFGMFRCFATFQVFSVICSADFSNCRGNLIRSPHLSFPSCPLLSPFLSLSFFPFPATTWTVQGPLKHGVIRRQSNKSIYIQVARMPRLIQHKSVSGWWEWGGMGWNGVVWSGVGWSGVERGGLGWRVEDEGGRQKHWF